MKINTSCCSGSVSPCDSSIAELPRYYPRQLITPDDLTLEQNYFRDRMRRHNRLLHGWGVVCGALVCPVPNPKSTGLDDRYLPWVVRVEKGYALGPYGDEIILDCERTVDLRTKGVAGVTGEPCFDAPDPWCSQAFVNQDKTTLYIAVKYKQCMARPVRVQPLGCGCDDTSCEYSRWHDGYEIGVLADCPPCNDLTPSAGMDVNVVDLNLLAQGDTPQCPECCSGPWVGLAEVTFDADGTITAINNCSCRRMVLSFSQFWWSCKGAPPTISDAEVVSVAPAMTGANMKITGTRFRCGAVAKFKKPEIFTVTRAEVQDPQTMSVMFDVSSSAKSADSNPGITVSNLDGSAPATFETKITVRPASGVGSPTGTRTSITSGKPVKKPTKPTTPNNPD